MADRIAVMYAGRIVEMAPKRQLFERPRHPYTETLLAAVLRPDPRLRSATLGTVRAAPGPQAGGIPGCGYAARCPYVIERCRVETPESRAVAPDHLGATSPGRGARARAAAAPAGRAERVRPPVTLLRDLATGR